MNQKNTIDILAFGAHADDVEIGMSGSIAKWTKLGKKVVICDLTEAELSSNGTVPIRKQEAEQAASIIGVHERINLQMPDRGLLITEEKIASLVKIIRTYKPKLIFAPYYEDRHPDHANCAQLVREAFFSAGIAKYDTSTEVHKANKLCYYMINGNTTPDFVVNISNEMDVKEQALRAYRSQFMKTENSVDTPLTNNYIERVVARDRLFGTEVGVHFAEGFKINQPIVINEDIFGDNL